MTPHKPRKWPIITAVHGSPATWYRNESRGFSRPMKSNYSNTAQLKDLMTVPPMTAAQHAEVMRKRIAHRRMVEEAKEMKKAESWQFDKR